MEEFAQAMHGVNVTQNQFNALAAKYLEFAETQAEAVREHNAQRDAELIDSLSEEYGGMQQFKMHQRNVSNFLTQHFGAEGVEMLQAAIVGKDAILNDPKIFKGLVELANSWSPSVLPRGGGNDPGKAIDTRLSEIRAIRQQNSDKFWKNEALVKEERELLEAKQRMG